jgi:glutathione S-transferase
VLVCVELEVAHGVIDPIVPFYGNDALARLSALRHVPVLIDARATLADSTVICECLGERNPFRPLRPQAPALRAGAHWMEAFADARLGEAMDLAPV